MLIGTTVWGLQRMLRLMRLAESQAVRAEEINPNIFEATEVPANVVDEDEKESHRKTMLSIRKTIEEDKDGHISWMMSNHIVNLANSNIEHQLASEKHEQQSFAQREAQRVAAQKALGV